MSENPRCPCCKSKTGLAKTYSLLFTLVEWPLMLLFAGCVMIFGGLTMMAPFDVFFFVFLAIFPLFLQIVHKTACLNCGIEFDAEEESECPVQHQEG